MEETLQELDWFDVNTLRENWSDINQRQKQFYFFKLTRVEREDLFLSLNTEQQIDLLEGLPLAQKRSWLHLLPLDDTVDFIQRSSIDERHDLLSLFDGQKRRDIMGLLAYAEDDAGGLMNPHFVRLRPDISVDEAIRYLRAQSLAKVEAVYYAYVLDTQQKLMGVVTFKELLLSHPKKLIHEIMNSDLVAVPETMDREEVSRFLNEHDFMAIPVTDSDGRMKGIVTFDDVAVAVEKETTEDIHKIGGMEALDAPYFKVSFWEMIKKRAGWLTALFLGEMFTASAMGHYEHEIEKAVVLALFIPLIISSGGNSGSQASTLIIRSLALREVRLSDWLKVFWRELRSGLALGLVLGGIGFLRIVLWQQWQPIYGDHYLLVAATVALSLIGVVIWGTLSGSMLPFLLRKLKFDPASASAPFVATLVDVTGLVIYFTVGNFILKGTLL